MAYDDSRKKEEYLESDRSVDDVGLAAGRTQRERKRCYQDLLQEEEEIAAQVRKLSEKRLKVKLVFLGTEPHKKKRKHSSDEFSYRDLSPLDLPSKKKKKAVSSPPSADTTMDLLKAITSPLATSSKSSKKTSEKSSSYSSSGHSESKKEHHKKKLSGSSGEHSLDDGSYHKSKKMKPLYVNTETLTLREPDGLKMKLILSPKEKGSSAADNESFPYSSPPATAKKSSKKSARDEQGSFLLGHELQSFLKSSRKKHKPPPDPHPPSEGFGADTSFSEGHGSECDISGLEAPPESGSSSGGELEAGELVIDDSYREIKKKKKSKKSKKKKDKEKHREKKHSKSKKSSGHPVAVAEVTMSPPPPTSTPYVLPPPPPVFHSDGQGEKKRRKEDKEREKTEKWEKPKKKNMSAYQVFCKEYRTTIVSEHPGIDFGELSKKLAEVWKQLPEKDKLIWKQKAQYLQHKQNKAEATTVKRKASSSDGAPKVKASPTGVLSSPHKKSPSSTVVVSVSPAKVPETDPIDVAAHLQLLGESLSLIGHRLQETEGMVAVSGSLSVLLDSIICALGPLACLTTQLPELNGCPKQVLSNTLDNIAYIMPGL
ncbi:HMG domain-containing protein 4 [Struthio camelus australis]|uniref:High mobility group protein 2-like 1 n=1 Tax=Struthio camelus australis TaxID=441894 RepID=A0A093HTX4_STRCA|nr:HMG domain-containing protein 4 [Struthio camelus australis]